MKKILKSWQIGGFVFTGILGVLLHFLYDLTNQSVAVALISAVNESIWEHMKLLLLPMFIFSLIQYLYIGKLIENFWSAKLAGAIIGLILIPAIYYTYTGILGVNADWFNIVIFFVAAGASYYLETLFFKNRIKFCKSPIIAFTVLCLIVLVFAVMTFVQPQIPLFQDPTTGKYGI